MAKEEKYWYVITLNELLGKFGEKIMSARPLTEKEFLEVENKLRKNDVHLDIYDTFELEYDTHFCIGVFRSKSKELALAYLEGTYNPLLDCLKMYGSEMEANN